MLPIACTRLSAHTTYIREASVRLIGARATPVALHTMSLPPSLDAFQRAASPSWVTELEADPDAGSAQIPRRVKSGHYVIVQPTPLPDPRLKMVSAEMLEELALDREAASCDAFARFFGADSTALPLFDTPFATPYALAIYGDRMYRQCPFGTGEGYGDGRAISVAEVVVNGHRWDLQLKGAGRTPFARGGDGRAVLRSSLREFLVSEAMHALGVSTTRALSLVTSSATVQRPWYTGRQANASLPSLDDRRIAHLPPQIAMMLLQQLQMQQREPDVMIEETCAITCRAAPSFIRVGHVDLFARRVRGEAPVKPWEGRDEAEERVRAKRQLRQMVDHMRQREYPEATDNVAMLQEAARRIAALTADWIRVGFVQGNFNSDNCLVAGRTMDYGPFGFVERFEPLWNMWVGGGEHFGFLNQMKAGEKNFAILAESVQALGEREQEIEAVVEAYPAVAAAALQDVWRRKLGLSEWSNEAQEVLEELLSLMHESEADYTLTWRELATVAETLEPSLAPLESRRAFYKPMSDKMREKWLRLLQRWLPLTDTESPAMMRAASPKYVPREWMLVEAYRAAQDADVYCKAEELHELLKRPYDEQPAMEDRFYRPAPSPANVPGTSFMS